MMRRSWDCCLPPFSSHKSLGNKTMKQELEGMAGGGTVDCVCAIIQHKKGFIIAVQRKLCICSYVD